MDKRTIEVLLTNLVNDQISKHETVQLTEWLEDENNQKVFREFMITHNLIEEKLPVDSRLAYQAFCIARKQQRKKKTMTFIRYAAAIVILLGIVQFYFTSETPSEMKATKPVSEITLTLENGAVEILAPQEGKKDIKVSKTTVAVQNANTIIYPKITNGENALVNTLSIPLGETFQVSLSDGTIMYLNAGSRIKYPVSFGNNGKRVVELLEGEAYFEVAKDPDMPFEVKTNTLNINVLGTKFNVSSYKEDENYEVVLAEGAVQLTATNSRFESQNLVPGDRATWNKTQKALLLTQVDPEIYTSWINGKLIFKNIKFSEILKKLERKYNIRIENKNRELGEESFNATFDNESIQQVIESFSKTYDIEYTLTTDKLIIH